MTSKATTDATGPNGMAAPGHAAGPAPTRAEEIIQYPTDFPIKIMGNNADGFVHAVVAVVKKHAPTFDAATLELRESAGGKYLGITVTITATSRQQLDALYMDLTSHPLVKVVL